MDFLTANLTGKVRHVTRNGSDWLVAPLTLIVPGVLAGSQGALYYPLEEIRRDPSAWNGMPLVVYHPSVNGQHISARNPITQDTQGIGYVYNAAANGKLTAEGWFSVQDTQRVDARVLNALERGQPIELSTGLFTDNEPAHQGATYNGRAYSYIARNYRPDHLAILPDQKGACSIADGCGVLVNQEISERARQLGQLARSEKITLGNNPPSWVLDEPKWERAKEAAAKAYAEDDDSFWPVVVSIYEKMGGPIQATTVGNTTHHKEGGLMTDKQRQAAIADLIGNCACWDEGDRAYLTGLPDNKLQAFMQCHARETVVNQLQDAYQTAFGKSLTVNEIPKEFIDKMKEVIDAMAKGGKGADDKEAENATTSDESGQDDSGDTASTREGELQTENARRSKKQTSNMTVDAWLASAPSEIQNAVRNAMAIERAQREALVNQLVAHVADGDLKKRLIANHLKKPLNVLQDEVAGLPSAVQASNGSNRVANYYGANSAPPTANQPPDFDKTDFLDLPTINWAKEAAETAGRGR